MLTFFSLIQFLLNIFGLWEEFLRFSDSQRLAEDQLKTQKRNDAVDDSKKAKTDDDVWKSQDTIITNRP